MLADHSCPFLERQVLEELQMNNSCPPFLAAMRRQSTVRRQTLWNHLTLFLRDTFLPVASPV